MVSRIVIGLARCNRHNWAVLTDLHRNLLGAIVVGAGVAIGVGVGVVARFVVVVTSMYHPTIHAQNHDATAVVEDSSWREVSRGWADCILGIVASGSE